MSSKKENILQVFKPIGYFNILCTYKSESNYLTLLFLGAPVLPLPVSLAGLLPLK